MAKVLNRHGALVDPEDYDPATAKKNCKGCHGSGYQGRNVTDGRQGIPIICYCVKRREKEKV